MRKFLVIAADQARLGSAPGPHTLKPEHVRQLRQTTGAKAKLIVTTPEEAKTHLRSAEMIAAFPMRMPKFADVPQAKWLHSFSAGVDEILSPEIVSSKILLSNSSGIHATPIAEHILGFMLMFTRGFHTTARNQEKHLWKKDLGLRELRGANVLIVGFGEIGKETARLAASFGANISAVSRSLKKKPVFITKIGTSAKLDSMLKDADFVVITLPYTKVTHHLFDRARFRKMKKSAIVINIGRGSIINEKTLVKALKEGEIAGAGLDVTETEPLPKVSPLWDMENVIITPHHSGLSHKYMDRAVELLCTNIYAYTKGRRLPNEVDKRLGY